MDIYTSHIASYLSDSRGMKLVCSSWNQVIEQEYTNLIHTLLLQYPDMTLYEILIQHIIHNDIFMVNTIKNMSYKPIQWNWCIFYIRSNKMYNILQERIDKSYKVHAHYMFIDKNTTGRIFSGSTYPLISAILQDDHQLIKEIYENLYDPMRYEVILECASKEVRDMLNIEMPPLYKRKIQYHMFPFVLPDREITTLVKYDRIDLLDILIAQKKITFEDIYNACIDAECGVSPQLSIYLDLYMRNYL